MHSSTASLANALTHFQAVVLGLTSRFLQILRRGRRKAGSCTLRNYYFQHHNLCLLSLLVSLWSVASLLNVVSFLKHFLIVVTTYLVRSVVSSRSSSATEKKQKQKKNTHCPNISVYISVTFTQVWLCLYVELFSQNLLKTVSGHSTAAVGRCFQQLSIHAKIYIYIHSDYRSVFETGVRKVLKKVRSSEVLMKTT